MELTEHLLEAVLNRPMEKASELVLDVEEVYMIGKRVSKITQTCVRFRGLLAYRIITEFVGNWLFVQYQTRVVICDVSTLALPKGFGNSKAEEARLLIQYRLQEVIDKWRYFQKEVLVEGIFKGEEVSKKIRTAMVKEVNCSKHLRKEGENVGVRAKIYSVVAVVERNRGNSNIGNEWMNEQISLITRHRWERKDYKLWSGVIMGAYNPMDVCWTSQNLDTGGLRERILEFVGELTMVLDESKIIRLLRDPSYTTMDEILTQVNQTISPMMTYLEIK